MSKSTNVPIKVDVSVYAYRQMPYVYCVYVYNVRIRNNAQCFKTVADQILFRSLTHLVYIFLTARKVHQDETRDGHRGPTGCYKKFRKVGLFLLS